MSDKLTGLPNRISFQQRLTQSLETAVSNEHQCAVMHIDPRFKKINDSLGQAMGDLVLKAIAQRLEGLILLGDKTLEYVPSADPFVAHLAHGLNLSVVAEGVETVPQIEFLRSVGCDQMQGFLACKGVPIPEFLHFVQRHRAHGWQPLTPT